LTDNKPAAIEISDEKTKKRSRIFDYMTPAALVVFIIAILGVPVHIISYRSVAFADFWNLTVCAAVRCIIAQPTNILPFSLGEIVVLLLPFGIIAFLTAVIVMSIKGSRKVWKLITSVFAVAAYVYILLSIGYIAGYNTTTVDKKLGLDRQNVSGEELYKTACLLRENENKYLNRVVFGGSGASVMPYSIKAMNDKLIGAYEKASEKYDFIPTFYSRVKPILLSEPMTYTHLSGVYTLYTGEANINTNFPDYTLPFTACHELSHQRGINREDEANFLAFIVSIESDDPYILYSAYQNMLEYVLSALYSADKDLYMAFFREMDPRPYYEMVAYNRFFDKYRESKAAEVTDSVNDSYLKASGQPQGTKSYGLVVDLAVAYYRDSFDTIELPVIEKPEA
jgi:hypothetical protein